MAKRSKSGGDSPESIIDNCLEEEPIIPGPVPMWIPSGISQLDWAIHEDGQGYPCGRMMETFGDNAAGKTLLSLLACRNAMRMGGSAIYLDMEAAFSEEWAIKLGLPAQGLILRTPQCLEEVHDIIGAIVSKWEKFAPPIMIVWDSLAASASRASTRKKSARDVDPIGGEARLNGSFFRRSVLKDMRNLPICLSVINQVRDKIGGNPYDNETTPGGRAIKFYASLRLNIKRKRTMKPKKEGALPVGAFVRVKVVKNKIDRPYRMADFPIYFNRGVDPIYECMYYSELNNVIQATGNGRLIWKDKSYLKGDFWKFLRENNNEYEELKAAAKANYFSDLPLGGESYDVSDDD